MNKKLIEALRQRALTTFNACDFRERDRDTRHAAGTIDEWRKRGSRLWYELDSHDTITFYLQGTGHRAQYIKFSGIRPVNATDVIIHPPTLKDRKTVDASTHTVVNGSNATVKRTYTVEKAESTDVSHEVGVAVTLGLRGALTIGNDASPVKKEIEITAEVSSHYQKTMSKTEASTIATSTEVEIPPKGSVTFTTNRSVAKYEQELEYTANIDHKTEIVFARENNWGDRIHWVEFKDWHTALRIMQGGGYKDDECQQYVEDFRKKPIAQWEVDKLTEAKGVPITVKVEFDEATVTDVAVK